MRCGIGIGHGAWVIGSEVESQTTDDQRTDQRSRRSASGPVGPTARREIRGQKSENDV